MTWSPHQFRPQFLFFLNFLFHRNKLTNDKDIYFFFFSFSLFFSLYLLDREHIHLPKKAFQILEPRLYVYIFILAYMGIQLLTMWSSKGMSWWRMNSPVRESSISLDLPQPFDILSVANFSIYNYRISLKKKSDEIDLHRKSIHAKNHWKNDNK